MLARLTAKNQITLPKRITDELGPVEHFEAEVRNGEVVLRPVRIHRPDAVRAKVAERELSERTIRDAVEWARATPTTSIEPTSNSDAHERVALLRSTKPDRS